MALSTTEIRRGAGLKDRHMSPTAGIRPYKMDKLYRHVVDDCKGQVTGCKLGGLAATTTDGHILTLKTGRGTPFDKLNIDTQATDPLPVAHASGLDISSTSQTSAKGAEYVIGGLTNPAMSFVIGTDEFFIRATFNIHDVSGTDLWLGFRKNIAFVANVGAWGTAVPVATYLDMATVFYDGTATVAAGKTQTQTTVGGATAVTTDMSLATADDGTYTAEIQVDLGGNARYLFNGASNTAAVAYQFTSGLTVVPFMAFLNTADVGDGVFMTRLECGLKSSNVRTY